jgi:hypothetical protein
LAGKRAANRQCAAPAAATAAPLQLPVVSDWHRAIANVVPLVEQGQRALLADPQHLAAGDNQCVAQALSAAGSRRRRRSLPIGGGVAPPRGARRLHDLVAL